ncbi:hypothetical protein MD484_g598, partial [Candolleomyces efflorescens]
MQRTDSLVIRKGDERNPFFWITTGIAGVWNIKHLEIDYIDDATWPSFLALLPHLFKLETLSIGKARLSILNDIPSSFVPLLRVYNGPVQLLGTFLAGRRLEQVTVTKDRFFERGLLPLFGEVGVAETLRELRINPKLSLTAAGVVLGSLSGYTALEGLYLDVDDGDGDSDSEDDDSDYGYDNYSDGYASAESGDDEDSSESGVDEDSSEPQRGEVLSEPAEGENLSYLTANVGAD